MVVYAGHGVGQHLHLVAKMFPTLQFLVYDKNPAHWLKQQVQDGTVPPNIHLKQCWFHKKEAEIYMGTREAAYDPGGYIQHTASFCGFQYTQELKFNNVPGAGNTLLISTLQNVLTRAVDSEGKTIVAGSAAAVAQVRTSHLGFSAIFQQWADRVPAACCPNIRGNHLRA